MPARKRLQGEIATPLADARARAGVYQHELAKATGISLSSYRRLELGLAENAPLWWYVNCSIALNVPLDEVIGELRDAWHPTEQAPERPGNEFLSDRWERGVAWAEELPDH